MVRQNRLQLCETVGNWRVTIGETKPLASKTAPNI